MRLLLIEDEPELARRMLDRLRSQGFIVDQAVTAADSELWPDLESLDAIILDLGLPDGDGLNVLQHWRTAGITTPVIILTARGRWQDKVDGLNLGADDFVVKPVRFEELLARIHAVVRRRSGRQNNYLQSGDITLDLDRKLATSSGVTLSLSRQEWRLLHRFMERPGHVFSSDALIDQLYDLGQERDRNAVEALVSRLRRKIGHDRISTVRGLGYRFA